MFNYNLLGGPLFEEPGWRGFLQPRLEEIMHPWGCRHLCGNNVGRMAYPTLLRDVEQRFAGQLFADRNRGIYLDCIRAEFSREGYPRRHSDARCLQCVVAIPGPISWTNADALLSFRRNDPGLGLSFCGSGHNPEYTWATPFG